ncbi:MAG: hypothetical protein K1060chlam4_01443, partial [Candidatus Anoxychlamydiales bacterium]|nr:hypothetical protein [Candidatus Anoxychlamydiales bacterium]
MPIAAVSSSGAIKVNFFSQVKIKVNLTYKKVRDFIKTNFLKLTSFALVVCSYFVFGFEVS